MQAFPGAVDSKTWYPVALANKLAGSDLEPGVSDLEASFNSHFTYGNESGWYFGADGKPPFNKWDFVSVVLHEIGHGLGFSGSMVIKGGRGSWGWGVVSDPVIYDRFVINGYGKNLVGGFSNNSTELATQLTCNNLYFSGVQATAANGGVQPKLFAPVQWKPGSSYSHLDDNTYPASSGNALMTPSLSNGEAVHGPGAIAMGVFADIGWGDIEGLVSEFSVSTSGVESDFVVQAPSLCYDNVTYLPSLLFNFSLQN
jgi:hypothetical protein